MIAPITQARLRRVLASQDLYTRDRDDLVADVLRGAAVEPGEYGVNPSAVEGEVSLIVILRERSRLTEEPGKNGNSPVDPTDEWDGPGSVRARLELLRRSLREDDLDLLLKKGVIATRARSLRRERRARYWRLSASAITDAYKIAALRLKAASFNEDWANSPAILDGFFAVAACAARLMIAGVLTYCHGPSRWINTLVDAALAPFIARQASTG